MGNEQTEGKHKGTDNALNSLAEKVEEKVVEKVIEDGPSTTMKKAKSKSRM